MLFLACIQIHSIDMLSRTFALSSIVLAFLIGFNAPAMSAESVQSTSEQGVTQMDELGEPVQTTLKVQPANIEKFDEMSPFLRDSTFNAQIRTYFFDHQNFNDSFNEALAVGGSLAYKSGYLADLFRVGAVAYTSQRLYGPDSRDGTTLLQTGQKGYSVLGQLYGDIKLTNQLLASIGRKEYNTPYINGNDSRMTPNTFQGYSIWGTTSGEANAPAWRYAAGYMNKIKERNSDEFVWMSSAAGADVHRGVYAAGTNFQQKDFSIGAVNYYAKDIINIFYTEAKYILSLADRRKLTLSGQYTDQRSTGDDLLKGYAFSTQQTGIKADLAISNAVLTTAYTNTANSANMQSPWGSYPGYNHVQVENFNRAGESALMLRAAYDFSATGLEGLSAYILKVHGSGVENPSYNEDEIDLNLEWVPRSGPLKNFSFRTRYALVSQQGGGDPDINEFRFIVNYDF